MRTSRLFFLFALFAAFALPACRQAQPEDVMLHTGRNKSLVGPLIQQFARKTGISVSVQYGEDLQMADNIARDSTSTSADVLWTKGAAALGQLQQHGLLAALPDSLTSRVPAPFRGAGGAWVGVSGRGHVLVHSDTAADVPESVFALADSSYDGRLGWSTNTGSFRNLVTAMRITAGHDSTLKWLKTVYQGGAQVYEPGEIVRAVADGNVAYALTTHDNFYRTRAQADSLTAQISPFRPGDPGNLIDVAGIGVLKRSNRKQRALRLVRFLLSKTAQQRMASSTYEYPLAQGIQPDSLKMVGAERPGELAPDFDLGKLYQSDSTRNLLSEAGVL